MSPRTLLAMVGEFHKIENHKAKILAHVMNGGKLTDDDDYEPDEIDVHPDCF